MRKMLKECKRYLLIYGVFARNSISSMMEYRLNFIFGIMIELGFLAVKLSYVYVIYRIGVQINGLSPDEIVLFIGTYTIMAGVYSTLFYTNFVQLPEHIRTGTLDVMMTKPISLQFMSTMRSIDIGFSIPNLIGGIAMVVYGWNRSNVPLTPMNLIGFIGFLLIGVIVTYAVFLLPQLAAFWTVRTGGINEVSNALFDFNQMPMGIYGKTVQGAGTFLIPVFLISNWSPLFVLDRMSPVQFLWGLLAPLLFMLITRAIWKIAIRNYTSASS